MYIDMWLDLDKSSTRFSTIDYPIVLRAGDSGAYTARVHLTQSGEVFNLTGHTVRFYAELPSGTQIIEDATITSAVDGIFEYLFPDPLMSVPGRVSGAYFLISKEGFRASTGELMISVIRPVIDWNAAHSYAPMIDRLIDALEAQKMLYNDQEDARSAAEQERAAHEAERVSHEESRVSAERDRVAAEVLRVQHESEREDQEAIRVANERQRIAKETERLSAEQERLSAENARASAENERVSADSQRTSQQSKNNSDQAYNNLLARQGQPKYLSDGQYNPDTLEPTIAEPLPGVIYLVPIANPTQGDDAYVEWLYREEASRWERLGSAGKPLTAISTDQIDAAFSDGQPTGDEVMNLTATSYFASAVKGIAQGLTHDIEASEERSRNASNLTSGTVALARGGTGAANAQAARDNLGITEQYNYLNTRIDNTNTNVNNVSSKLNTFIDRGSYRSDTNVDTLTGAGTYIIADCAGLPSGAYKYGYLVVSGNSTFLNQMYITDATGEVFVRSKWGNAWRSWREIPNEADLAAKDFIKTRNDPSQGVHNFSTQWDGSNLHFYIDSTLIGKIKITKADLINNLTSDAQAQINSLSSRISGNDTDISNLQAKDTSLQSQITNNDTDIAKLIPKVLFSNWNNSFTASATCSEPITNYKFVLVEAKDTDGVTTSQFFSTSMTTFPLATVVITPAWGSGFVKCKQYTISADKRTFSTMTSGTNVYRTGEASLASPTINSGDKITIVQVTGFFKK